MEQGKEESAAVDSDPNPLPSAANVVVPPLPPTITNPIINNVKRAAQEEPQQITCAKKHKIDVQSILMEDHNQVEVPLCIKSTSTTQEAKDENISSNQFQEDEEDENSKMENDQHMEASKRSVPVEVPPDKKSIATTLDSHRGSISNEVVEEGADDTLNEVYQHLETPDNIDFKLKNKFLPDHSERLDLAKERILHPAATSDATGSKTLYLGNLNFSVEEDDVRDFFKDVGEIAAIRFAIRDERFLGYGHIEFTTSEAAQEALKLNKEVLLDRRVTLDLTRERGTYTPGNRYHGPGNRMVKYNQTGGQTQRKTVFVRGFRSSDGIDNIRSALEKHFRKCGEISRMAIPKDYESGASKGVAFIDFVDSNGFSRALGLNGSIVIGNRLTVEVAKKQSDGRESSVCEGRGWSLGSGVWVREIGSGWGRGNDYIGGQGRDKCYDGGRAGEIGYGGSWGRESFSGRWESGSASVSHRESFFARRESGPASTSRPESGSASNSSRESYHSSSWHRKIDFDGGLRRGNGFGIGPSRGSGFSSDAPRGNGFGSGPSRGSGFSSDPPRGNGFGSGQRRGNGFGSRPPGGNGFGSLPPRGRGSGTSWHRETGFGRGSGIEIRSDNSWRRESSSSIGVTRYGRHGRGR